MVKTKVFPSFSSRTKHNRTDLAFNSFYNYVNFKCTNTQFILDYQSLHKCEAKKEMFDKINIQFTW